MKKEYQPPNEYVLQRTREHTHALLGDLVAAEQKDMLVALLINPNLPMVIERAKTILRQQENLGHAIRTTKGVWIIEPNNSLRDAIGTAANKLAAGSRVGDDIDYDWTAIAITQAIEMFRNLPLRLDLTEKEQRLVAAWEKLLNDIDQLFLQMVHRTMSREEKENWLPDLLRFAIWHTRTNGHVDWWSGHRATADQLPTNTMLH